MSGNVMYFAFWVRFVIFQGPKCIQDLAFDPSKMGGGHASRHLKLVLAGHFTDPDLYYCGAPSYEKKTSHRTIQQVPIMLPSMIFQEAFANHVEPNDVMEPRESKARYDCEKLENHPVVLSAKAKLLHWSRVQVCAIYWDGVQYTKRDSFHALYLLNLRTGEKHIVFIVSSNLNHSEAPNDCSYFVL
jgi:hypothetical protein